MDTVRASSAKSRYRTRQRPRTAKSRRLRSSEDDSTDGKSDDDSSQPHHGSKVNLIRDRRKSDTALGSSSDGRSFRDSTVIAIEPEVHPTGQPDVSSRKDTSIAQSIRRKLSFFKKSDLATKTIDDPEAGAVEDSSSSASKNWQQVDVVVDVHQQYKSEEKPTPNRRGRAEWSARTLATEKGSESEIETIVAEETPRKSKDLLNNNSAELIEELKSVQAARTERLKRAKSEYFPRSEESDDISDSSGKPEILKSRSMEDLDEHGRSTSAESRRRKRWDESEVFAEDDLKTEDLQKPRRKRWETETGSAEIYRTGGKKIVLPKRSATAEGTQNSRPQSAKPVALPRTKAFEIRDAPHAFDNEGFSSDHDEVLRVETVNNESPKIKMGILDIKQIEDQDEFEGIETISDEDILQDIPQRKSRMESQKVEEFSGKVEKSPKRIENKSWRMSVSDSSDSSSSKKIKQVPPSSIRSRSRLKNKSQFKRKISTKNKDISDEVESEQEELKTVVTAQSKKIKSSSSSISSRGKTKKKMFAQDSSDETTISTSEEMKISTSTKKKSRTSAQSVRRDRAKTPSPRKSSLTTNNESATEPNKKKKVRKKKSRKKYSAKKEDVVEELKYISVVVHKSDLLEPDYVTRHPMVRIHLVYAETGEYLKVRDAEEDSDTFLKPLVTRQFDFKEKHTMVPVWEEELVFQHDYGDLLSEGKGAVIFLFEIFDILGTDTIGSHGQDEDCEKNSHKVAWAFLRPKGVQGTVHLEKKVRLQLYRPKKSFRKTNKQTCQVYRCWKSKTRIKYPSSLFVTVSKIDPPKIEPLVFAQLQLYELSQMQNNDTHQRTEESRKSSHDTQIVPQMWSRLPDDDCEIPNELHLESEPSENGCFSLAFSFSGRYLACALSEEYDYPIVVYKVDDGKIHVRFNGHKNFIYSLNWSQDDRFLLSVSSDQTARLWDVEERIIEYISSLPHPSYVYCGKFFPGVSSIILTGCYDHVARVWARTDVSDAYELIQEFEAHQGFVNALCFQKDWTFLTGDALGVVIIWSAKRSRKSPVKREWQVTRKIKIREIEGVPINSMIVQPGGARLLLHTRNNGLRLLDLQSGTVLRKFEGLRNQRIQIRACISPCGSLIFCGDEHSRLNVWDADSGKLIATYDLDVPSGTAVSCVDYHPFDHSVAVSVYGAPVPVKILKFDLEADGQNVSLTLLERRSSQKTMSRTSTPQAKGRFSADVKHLNLPTDGDLSKFEVNQTKNQEREGIHSADLKSRLKKFMENGPTLKTKTRLNGIIEKIDKILMYATVTKSPAMDLDSVAKQSVITVESANNLISNLQQDTNNDSGIENRRLEFLELKIFSANGKRSSRQMFADDERRTKSAREFESSDLSVGKDSSTRAFSDSAAMVHQKFLRRTSDDSSTSRSNRSFLVRDKFGAIHDGNALSAKTNSPQDGQIRGSSEITVVPAKQSRINRSDEVIDMESSAKSDETYIIETKSHGDEKQRSSGSGSNSNHSDQSNATFVIESDHHQPVSPPVPKPRKKFGRLEV